MCATCGAVDITMMSPYAAKHGRPSTLVERIREWAVFRGPDKQQGGKGPMSNRLRTAVIILVSLVWAINFTAPVFVQGYEPAPELNVAFMAIIGILTSTYKKEEKTPPNTTNKGTGDE